MWPWIGVYLALALGFNPPDDRVGPISLHIEGPTKVTAVDKPLPVTVVLSNDSGDVVKGSLRVQGVDHWRVEPADPKPFEIPGKGAARLDFTAAAGAGTYNALYPIHAFAEFEAGGARQQAHAVLIVETQLTDAPHPTPNLPWQPLDVPANCALSLVHAPLYRAVVAVFGEAPQTLAPGWSGSEGRTRANLDPTARPARPDVRDALGVHPPWYEGHVGTLFVEYPLRLPQTTPIRLKFANAMRDTTATEPPSDGVTFRVRVVPFDAPDGQAGVGPLARVLFERHTDAKQWQDAVVDLSAYAGKTIRLQLESHPGPKNDTTCDAGYWAGLELTCGTPNAQQQATGERQAIGEILAGDRHYNVSVQPGARGLSDAIIAFASPDSALSFQGFPVRVLGDALEQSGSFTEFLGATSDLVDGRYVVHHKFRSWSGTFDVVGELWVENNKALRARFHLEHVPSPKPWFDVHIEDLCAGPWSEKLNRVYAGVGNVLDHPTAFELGFDGHQLSASFVGFDFANGVSLVQAVDVPPNKLEVAPDARRCTIHTALAPTMTIIPCANIWAGVSVWRDLDSRPAASSVAKLAGRFVFDLWGGNYGPSADELRQAFRYGLTDSAVVWHNWQRWGYDYRLPDIFPPNPDFGTIEAFQALARTCSERGVIFAPHDNYIDFYPDAEGFSYEHVAFTRDSQPIRAWLNEGRGAQAFRWRTDAYRPFMERNLKLIREHIAPTGYFIDVFSSIGPYDSWTWDGQFQDRVFTRDTWGKTFAWIRDYLGDDAPQISESGHDQLIGYLDGAQCNHLRVDSAPPKGSDWMVWRIKCADAERIPWIDMAYHDRFALHGAGYEGRYLGGLDADLHGIYSDDYMATEVLTGHPAMVPAPFNTNVVRKYWLLHDLMRALALQRIESVEFVDGNLHRQHVRWQNGGETWVNRGKQDWIVSGHVLPEYGFFARVGGVEAAIERRDDLIVEWSRSPEAYYVNARPVVNAKQPVRVASAAVTFLNDRDFELQIEWNAERPLKEAVQIFTHFVDKDGKICFQADATPPTPTTQWQGVVRTVARGTIPPQYALGDTFELRVGLWRPDLGRLTLPGPCDQEQRIRVGTVRLDGEGNKLTGLTWAPTEVKPDPVLARMNPDAKMITFDWAATNGGCRVTKDGPACLVVPLPGGPAFSLSLNASALPFYMKAPQHVGALDEKLNVVKTMPVQKDANRILLTCEPGIFAYRLTE